MAHGTRSSRKIKDDENENSIGRQISSKGSSTSGSSTPDTPALRRSSRETLLKKNNSLSPSTTRKSERPEKPMPETPQVKRKSERVESKLTPSPLRRSERSKTHSSTSSPSKRSAKSLNSSSSKEKMEKKDKNVKDLTLGTKELCKGEKPNVQHGQVKHKRLKSRAYLASLYKKFKGPDLAQKQSGEHLSPPCHSDMIKEHEEAPERVQVECSAVGKLTTLELSNSTSNGRISEGGDCTPSKRKKIMVDGETDGTKDVCTLIESCDVCFKRQRIDSDPMKREFCVCGPKLNQELSGAVNQLDSGEVLADSTTRPPGSFNRSVQQKELSADLQTNGEENTCLICTLGGKLLLGKNIYCSVCLMKNLSGIHAFPDRLESVRDAREVEVSDGNVSSRFIEYWVPVQLSNVQRELYCKKLLLNPTLLHSSSTKALVGALHDLLRSTRKCCDHPYIEEVSLGNKLVEIEGIPKNDFKGMLDLGIKASGKLQLLDKMLMEIKTRGLRVLILYQKSIGSQKICIGDILDDFLRQRFGEDSYERVEQDVAPANKGEAMVKFNNRECGRFAFLLEARACRSIIKLSAVDTIIIYGSDWNPVNDVKALQKISLDSKFEQIKVFRLYSTCTIEEKVLILTKQEKVLENNLLSISRNICQMLLLYGAPYQFDKLNEFHNNPTSTGSIIPVESTLQDVIPEFMSLLSQDAKNNGLGCFSVISKAHQTKGGYGTKNPLFSELKSQHTGDGKPLSFWSELLEGQHPQWKYCLGLSQRNRKRGKHTDEELSKRPQVESDENINKRKKVVHSITDLAQLKRGCERRSMHVAEDGFSVHPAENAPHSSSLSTSVNHTLGENHTSTSHNFGRSNFEIPESKVFVSEERRKLLDAQKCVHLHLKPEILKLCETLQFSEHHKVWVEKFLDYVMKNHSVQREPATLFQAFQISLCWTVASILKHKIDHKASFALAKQHFNFNCQKEEADRVYSMLRCLKKTFLYRTGIFKVADLPNFSGLSSSDANTNLQGIKPVIEDFEKHLAEKDLSKSINEIKKKFQKKMTKLDEKQAKERSELSEIYEKEKKQLELRHKVNLALNRVTSMGGDLENIEKEVEEHKHRVFIHLQQLEKLQLEAKIKLKDNENQWVQEVKDWVHDELFSTLLLNVPHKTVACSSPVRTVTKARNISANDAVDLMTSEVYCNTGKHKNGNSGFGQENVASVVPCAKVPVINGGSSEHGEALLDVSEIVCLTDGLGEGVTSSLSSFQERTEKTNLPICDREVRLESQTQAIDMPGMAGNEVNTAVIATVSSTDALGNLVSRDLPSSEKLISETPTEVENGEVQVIASDIANQKNGVDSELCLATQFIATIESECSDLEVTTIDPAVSSSETPDHCPHQLSSAAGIENQPTSDHQVQGNLLATLSTGTIDPSVSSSGTPDDCPHQLSSAAGIENQPTSEHQVQGTLLATSSTWQNENAQGNERQNTGQPNEYLESQFVAIIASDQSDHEESTVQLINRPEISSACSMTVQITENQNRGVLLATSTAVQDGDALVMGNHNTCQPVENPVSQLVGTVDEVPTSTAVVQSQLPTELTAGGNEIQPSTEDHTSNQVSRAPIQIAGNYSDQSNETALAAARGLSLHQPIDSSPNGFGLPSDTRTMSVINSHPIRAASQGALRMHHNVYPDPLQNELERLNKEMEQHMKSHEDKKLRLKSDYEKKIEEAVAELRRQCETKLKEEEAEFLHIKKKLDANHNIVLMNKILAEAFRSKFMDLRASSAGGVQQDGNSSFVQQLVILSMQQNVQRPSSVASSSSTGIPAASPQTSISTLPSLQPPVAPIPSLQPSIAPLPTPQTTQPACVIAPNQHYTAPIMQTVPLSPASSSFSARPPHIGTVSGSTGIPQGGGQIRSPAPHLQPYRPSTSLTSTSPLAQQGGTSNHYSHSNAPATSPSLFHTPQHPAPTQQTVPGSGAQNVESAERLLAPPSQSALELLMQMENRSGTLPPGGVVTPPSLGSLDHPDPAIAGSASANPVNTGGILNVVCISDDD